MDFGRRSSFGSAVSTPGMTHPAAPPPSAERPSTPPGWLFCRAISPNWFSYVFRGRFVDVRLTERGWQADEVCTDDGVGVWLATARSEHEVLEAVERLWRPRP